MLITPQEDSECIQQHCVTSITACEVQQHAHRKQGRVLPTLIVHISPNPTTDKLRKRRSTRTGGLTTTKDIGPTTLYFRPAEESRYSLGDWARHIQHLIQPLTFGHEPLSPVSPSFSGSGTTVPSAHSPLESPATETSTKNRLRSKLHSKSSSRAQVSSNDPTIASRPEAPSLRSSRSDMSSHNNPMLAGARNFVQQHYTNTPYSNLPSPTSTATDYQDHWVEGWTSAQGRSSALSSPTKERASTSSSRGPHDSVMESSSPPAPRETILDRAFQLRCIPGSEREMPGEEKLTSLAKFEALMREAEERQKGSGMDSSPTAHENLKSAWDEDDDSDEDEASRTIEEEEEEDSDEDELEQHMDNGGMDQSTFKALQFVANRHSSKVPARSPHHGEPDGLRNAPPVLRPHTAHSRPRPAAQRSTSHPHIQGSASHLHSLPPPRPMRELSQRTHEKRHSTSDVRKSDVSSEYSKRFSGTGSKMLLQTNIPTASNRGSEDYDSSFQTTPRGSLSHLTPTELDERFRWRGSIGVFGGNEGGFL